MNARLALGRSRVQIPPGPLKLKLLPGSEYCAVPKIHGGIFLNQLFHVSPPYFLKQLVRRSIHILSSGLVYTQLVNFESDEYVCKAARQPEDAAQLIEGGFEYVCTTPDGVMLFRKRK